MKRAQRTQWRLLSLGLVLAGGLLGLLLLSCQVSSPTPTSLVFEDWNTDNEDPCCPGDWDTVLYYTEAAGSYVTRTNSYAHGGSYSYEHYGDCPDSTCWAYTVITCSTPMTTGELSAWVRFTDTLPGIVLPHPFLSAGELQDLSPPGDQEAWMIYYDPNNGKAWLRCHSCDPDQNWDMANIFTEVWHEFRVTWNLPFDSNAGEIAAWMDGVLYVDQSGLTTESNPGEYPAIDYAGVGIKDWHFWWGDRLPMWTDDVVIYGCDEPTPTPTPAPTVLASCNQYGHAAVMNVDSDCSAVLRFRNLRARLPAASEVTKATLWVYGVALEGTAGETVYVAPLVPLWGEATVDWCSRTWLDLWNQPGAANVPLDRSPGSITSFSTTLGWIQIDLPTSLVEEWNSSTSANPGLILYNENLTARFSVASSEWYVDDYQPYLELYYED